ncbi:MAG: hypothetical protein ACE5DP_03820 [Fidelibacterota bacterium]
MNRAVILGFLFLFFSGCDSNNDCYTIRKPAAYSILVHVSGTAQVADILFVIQGAISDTLRLEDRDLPWSIKLEKNNRMTEEETWVYLTAQNQDSTGTISTALVVNGEELIRDTQSGSNAISSISYTILPGDYTEEVLQCP